ncbi:MAG TPA: hypothetical protein VGV68_01550 [Terriglobia bacterium]|nr:hypothetical protein [Terriglobia bacterium]
MRCKDVETILGEAKPKSLPEPVREHLLGCNSCRGIWRDWLLLRAGFVALAEDPAPQASLGFGVRLIRRLEFVQDPGSAAAEFFERVGRRFVLAGLLLAMLFILALVLPSSGPLRGPATAEVYLAQPEPSTQREGPILGDEFSDSNEITPVDSTNGSGKR